MRVLVASTRGAGHLGPLLPFARALVRAGHETTVAVPHDSAAMAERAGLATWALADLTREQLRPLYASLPYDRPVEANRVIVRELFGRLRIPVALPGTRAAIGRLHPDLIVRETFHYASALAAEDAGVAHVRVAPGMSWVDDRVAPLAAEGFPGLRSALAAIERTPLLTLAPPSFDGLEHAPVGPVARYRDDDGSLATEAVAPSWLPAGDAPLVYMTFGSVAANFPFFDALLRAALAALAELPVRLLLTIGERADPAELDVLPDNVRVERWVPQAQVLPHAAAMVCHGGFGTVLGGLYAGVPMVLVPMFADQPRNAARVAELGAGIVLGRGPRGVPGLGDAVRTVLGDPGYASAAARLAAEAAALAPVDEAVELLESRVG